MARKREPVVKPRNDAYTGFLVISLLAMIGSTVLLYLDYSQYPEAKPKLVTIPSLDKPKAVEAPEVPKATDPMGEGENKGENKGDTPMGDAPKGDAPKGDAPKGDGN